MKKKHPEQNKKLLLNKETISALHSSETDQVRGGAKTTGNGDSIACITGPIGCPPDTTLTSGTIYVSIACTLRR